MQANLQFKDCGAKLSAGTQIGQFHLLQQRNACLLQRSGLYTGMKNVVLNDCMRLVLFMYSSVRKSFRLFAALHNKRFL